MSLAESFLFFSRYLLRFAKNCCEIDDSVKFGERLADRFDFLTYFYCARFYSTHVMD